MPRDADAHADRHRRGTGPQGRGLGLRLALAGHRVLLGSRDAARGDEAAAALSERADEVDPAAGGRLEGGTNSAACADVDAVIVAVPYDAQAATLAALRLAPGTVVINCVNSLAFDALGPHPVGVADGSAAQECARLLPEARVVSAFGNVSATLLLRPPEPVRVDVLVCGDDEDAAGTAITLAGAIPGARGVHAGPLRLAGIVEDFTAVLLSINRRHRTHAGVRIDGLGAHD